ncbi:MFS transporter [Pseudomonas sp. microsymbiont 2]
MEQITPSAPRHRPALAAICLAALVLPLSFTGGAVATPAIGQAFAASPTALAWITNAFMLGFGGLLMAAGALADRHGRKRLFILGLQAFVLLGVLLACAGDILWLDLLRALQGIAAAAALASGSAALAQAFEGQARTRAFSLLGTTFGVGLAFGPLVCGLLVEHFGWRAIFLAGAALAAVAWWIAHDHLDESLNPDAQDLDIPGVASFTGMLVLFTCAVILGPQQGWRSPLILGLLAGSLLLLPTFILLELRSRQPMLDLRLFRHGRFIGVQSLPIGTCYCYIVLIVLLPLRLIGIEGLTPLHGGLLLLALSAPMLVVPLLAAWLNRWISAGTLCAVGFLLAALGLYTLTRAGDGEHLRLCLALLLIGTGSGLPWGLMDGLALSVVPREQAGMAAGIFNTTRVAGEGVALALTLAVLTALVDHRLQQLASPGLAAELAQRLALGDLGHLQGLDPALLRAAYLQGFNGLLWILIGITLAAAATALLLLRRPADAALPAAARPDTSQA